MSTQEAVPGHHPGRAELYDILSRPDDQIREYLADELGGDPEDYRQGQRTDDVEYVD